MGEVTPPPESGWRGWAAYFGVAFFGVVIDWLRRRMNRHEDELDRRARLRRRTHRRDTDPAGYWRTHNRDGAEDFEFYEDEEG